MPIASPAVALVNQRDVNPMLVSAGASAAAVASGTVIQTCTVSVAGNYNVIALSQPTGTGTIANTDAGNVLLQKNGNTVATLPQLASGTAVPLPLNLLMILAAGDVITLKVGANAAPAAVVYVSVLTVQQVS